MIRFAIITPARHRDNAISARFDHGTKAIILGCDMAHFLTDETVRAIQARFGTPVHVFDMATLVQAAGRALSMPAPFGLTVRYAMKACPNGAVLRIFDEMGLHIDASSGFEVYRARRAGIDLQRVQLTAQELPADLETLVEAGMRFNATSLHQLRYFGERVPGGELSIRLNPGLGSGHSQRTNVGGPASSFGIWHEQLAQVFEIQREYGLRITRLHSHIGSGADPAVWQRCAQMTLRLARELPQVHTVNLGGGFKVARAPGEEETDLHAVGEAIGEQLRRFRREDAAGRALHLEIEPGTYLVAHAGAIVSTVIDVKGTGPDGYRFIVVDSGMTDTLRPTLYGAVHGLRVVRTTGGERNEKDGAFVVVGHCCESGDVLTPAPGDPERLQPRVLQEPRVGDALVVEDTGAYGAAMSAKHYNSFPQSAQLLQTPDGQLHVIRRRQSWEEMVAAEKAPPESALKMI